MKNSIGTDFNFLLVVKDELRDEIELKRIVNKSCSRRKFSRRRRRTNSRTLSTLT